MKIFPPLSELLWPPGRSAADILWGRRYVLLVIASIAAGVIAWPSIRSAQDLPGHDATRVAAAPILVDGSACSSLSRESSPAAMRARPCGRSFRMKAGASVAAGRALKRSALPSSSGTLTAADRAIVSPRTLRSTVWDRINGPPPPALALSPAPK